MTSRHHEGTPVIVADVGATQIRVGTTGTLTPDIRFRTHDIEGDAALTLASLVRRVWVGSRSTRLVVGAPGLVDKTGSIGPALYSKFSHLDLRSRLIELLPEVSVVTVTNDATLLSAGVAALPDVAISDSHLHIVTGTAIGGALLFDRLPHLGSHGFAGEIGHVRAGLGDTPCPCGETDCIDLVASGWSLESDLGAHWWTRSLTPAESDRLELAARALARGIAACHQLVDLETFSVSGTLVAAAPWLGYSIQDSLTTYPELRYVDVTRHTHWDLATAGAQFLLELDRAAESRGLDT